MLRDGPGDLFTGSQAAARFDIGSLELAAGGGPNLLDTSVTDGANALYGQDLLVNGGLGQVASIRCGGASSIAASGLPESGCLAMNLAGLSLMDCAARRRLASARMAIACGEPAPSYPLVRPPRKKLPSVTARTRQRWQARPPL